jgi:hypothetical protein
MLLNCLDQLGDFFSLPYISSDANSMAFDTRECVQSFDGLVDALFPTSLACGYNDKFGSLEEESCRCM